LKKEEGEYPTLVKQELLGTSIEEQVQSKKAKGEEGVGHNY